jgi:ribonucleoside-diphosphate reductase alpha chain
VKRITSQGFVRSNLIVLRNAAMATAGNTALAQAHDHDHDHAHQHGGHDQGGHDHGNTVVMERHGAPVSAPVTVGEAVVQAVDKRMAKVREARMKGYEGDACGECGNFTLVRNGTCLKCTTCGGTSGCS